AQLAVASQPAVELSRGEPVRGVVLAFVGAAVEQVDLAHDVRLRPVEHRQRSRAPTADREAAETQRIRALRAGPMLTPQGVEEALQERAWIGAGDVERTEVRDPRYGEDEDGGLLRVRELAVESGPRVGVVQERRSRDVGPEVVRVTQEAR